MATTKMARLVAVTSSVGLLFHRHDVHASGNKVHPSELDIYDKPDLVQELLTEDHPSDLEVKVSTARKQVLGYWGSVKGIAGKGQSLFHTANNKSSEFMELISSDQTFQIKTAAISTGVLVGAVLAGRGKRPIRRILYSAGLGTVAASICYPYKAWDVSQKGFEQSKVLFKKLKTKYDEQKQKSLSEIPEAKDVSTPSKEEEFVFVEPVTDIKDYTESNDLVTSKDQILSETATFSSALDTSEPQQSYLSYIPFLGWFFKTKESDTNVVIETREVKDEVTGDHGQSKPEDKDMYSTRE